MNKPLIGAGGGGGKGGQPETHTPVESPDTLHSVAYARIVDLTSEGEIVGRENGDQDIFFDETPLQNADLTYNFKNVIIEERYGVSDQEPLANFPDVESETAVGVLVETDTPYTHTFTNLELTAVRVRLAVAALSEIVQEGDNAGDTNGYRIEYKIQLATDGGPFINVIDGAFDGKTSTVYERSHVIPLPEAAVNWSVRVQRITPESDSNYVQDDMSVVSYTELVEAKLVYPFSALIGIIIDASQFHSIPTRAYKLKGRIIRVPSNYDPVTRIYTGAWDGTFQPAWTDNPAWIVYDIGTHPRYGLGHLVNEAWMDKWSLYAIGQYCDEMVEDGKGGTEPRFTCNCYLQESADAYKVLQDLVSIFRGMVYWAAGAIITSADMPGDPIYSYNNANVIDGRFTYNGTRRRDRHTVALVGWNNPANFYRGEPEYCVNEPAVARYGIQMLTFTSFGCTSQGQAHRAGNWALLSEQLESNVVTFSVGLDGMIPQPGKVIKIFNKHRMGTRRGGRIRSATSTVLTPDLMPTSAVIGNMLTVILPSGVAQTRPISAVGVDTLTVSPAYDDTPLAQSVWGIESDDLQPEYFKVVAVLQNQSNPLVFDINAVETDPDKYEAIEVGLIVEPQNTQQRPPTVLPAPTNLSPYTYERESGGVTGSVIVVAGVSWTPSVGATSYQVVYRRVNDNWSPAHVVMSSTFEVSGVPPGDYTFKVVAYSPTGARSPEAESSTQTVPPATQYAILTDEDTDEILYDDDTGEILYGEV